MKNHMLCKYIGLILTVVLVLSACGTASSQPSSVSSAEGSSQEAEASLDYPKQNITFIVPYAAGGGTDISARILQTYAEQELGVKLTIVNKPGGGGELGFTEIAKANPDGYTIGYLNTPSAVTAYLDRDVQYDFDNSFEYICTQTLTPRLIAVQKDSQFDTIESFIEYAKAHPGELTVANTGIGGFAHVTTLALEQTAGITLTSVPFDGGSEALTALMGKQVDVAPLSFGEAKSAAENGEIKVLGLYTEEPSDTFPGVQTFREAGYDIVMVGIQPIVAPKGTPKEIVDFLSQTFEKVFANEEYIAKMDEAGNIPTYMNGADTEAFIKDSLEQFRPLMEIVKEMQS